MTNQHEGSCVDVHTLWFTLMLGVHSSWSFSTSHTGHIPWGTWLGKQEADEDGSGELDINEFAEKLGPYLGGNLSIDAIKQLFLKIDADAGGTVDWEEFTNFMFLERAQEATSTVNDNYRLFPPDFKEKNDPGVSHRGGVVGRISIAALAPCLTIPP
jgi:hypothetical protein